MLAYQLSVLPDDKTLSSLQNIFQYCPFSINWAQLHCELILTTDSAIKDAAEVNAEYMALPIHPDTHASNQGLMKVYDPITEMTGLYLPLSSDELYARSYYLRSQFKSLFHPRPFLYMLIKPDYHSCLTFNKYVNSISNMFVQYQEPLYFTMETVRAVDIDAPYDTMIYEVNGLK